MSITDRWAGTTPQGTGVHVVLSTGEYVMLERSYVERGWVDHAYALTIHKAQGITCDHVLIVGPAGLCREGIYVALSRARLSAWIYATTAQVGELDQRHDAGIPLPAEARHDPSTTSSPGCTPPERRRSSPSAKDRARNPHRPGFAWGKSAVRAILFNPRYTVIGCGASNVVRKFSSTSTT